MAIVGGGVIGASIAFHLGEGGVEDVLLLERAVPILEREPFVDVSALSAGRGGDPERNVV